ncbi:MAG: cupin domain-containing protein [Propionibacteriales bacterium]|nr:cupin domain-containing protein [Propionibacteriales bacterium]
MSPPSVPPIGERIREERARRGVTVRGLARDIGVSASLISQIETGRSQPSVSTLYAITTALDISIEDLFAPGDAAPESVEAATDDAPSDAAAIDATAVAGAVHAIGTIRSADQPSARPTPRTVGRDRGRRVGPVVHPDDREGLTLESGVVWELLGQVPGIHADFLLVTYQPGGSSSTSGALMRHTGTEYGYLIRGELILTLAFDEHHLQAGDAISFDSTTPHGYRNEGSEPAVGVWFIAESSH